MERQGNVETETKRHRNRVTKTDRELPCDRETDARTDGQTG